MLLIEIPATPNIILPGTVIKYVSMCIMSNWFRRKDPSSVPSLTKAATLDGTSFYLHNGVQVCPSLLSVLYPCSTQILSAQHLSHFLAAVLCSSHPITTRPRNARSSQDPTENKRRDLPYPSKGLAQIPALCRQNGDCLGHQ